MAYVLPLYEKETSKYFVSPDLVPLTDVRRWNRQHLKTGPLKFDTSIRLLHVTNNLAAMYDGDLCNTDFFEPYACITNVYLKLHDGRVVKHTFESIDGSTAAVFKPTKSDNVTICELDHTFVFVTHASKPGLKIKLTGVMNIYFGDLEISGKIAGPGDWAKSAGIELLGFDIQMDRYNSLKKKAKKE
jgi:hypothetical protein